MKNRDDWKIFEVSGKISDYLCYKENCGQIFTKNTQNYQAGEQIYDTAYSSNGNGYISNARG